MDIVRSLFAIAVALLFCAFSAAPALAHASLLSVQPADGTTVASAPATLSLTFNEQVAPVTLKLIWPDGRTSVLTPDVEGATLAMPAPPALGNGTYGLSWRVISADGHPVGGTTTFSIGAPSQGGLPQQQEVVDWPIRTGVWVTRVLTYAGLFVGIGGVFFVRWLGNGVAGLRASRAAAILGLATLPVAVGFQGLDVLDQPLGRFFAPETWQEGMASSFGLFAGVVLVGLALALVATARVGYERFWSLLAFSCVGLSLAATGHASAADPQWLTRPAVFIHTSVVAFWVGSLIPLGLLLCGPAETAIVPLRRFSAAIPPLLLLLLAAGVTLAIVQLGAPGEMLGTDYGHVFIAKMVLVAVLLGLAAFNRWGLTGSVLADAGAARNHLLRSIGIELGLVFAIFGVVALWRFTPPPRALLQAAAAPVSFEAMSGEGMADVVITPGHAGPVKVDVTVAGADMGPLTAQGVTLDFSNKDKGIEPIEREAKAQPDGHWQVDDLTLPAGGIWQVEIDVLVSDFREIDLSEQVEIRP